MTQKQRTLALLGGALLVSGALVGLALKTNQEEQQKKETEEKQGQLFAFDRNAVTSLKVTAREGTAELARTGDVWRLTAPVAAPADPGTVDQVLSRLSTIRKKQTVEDKPADLNKYGLAKPEIQVEASWAGGSLSLSLGEQNAYNNSQYARVGGSEAVLLVEAGNSFALGKTPFDFREKRIAPLDPKEVTALSVRTPDGAYNLERSGAGWRMTEPQAMRADDTAVSNLLSSLAGVKATAIPEESPSDLAKYGLDRVANEAVVTLPGGKLTVSFGTVTGGKLFARTSAGPAVYQVAANAPELLKQTPQSLEDKTILRFATDDVGAMSFVTPSGATVLMQRKRTPSADGGQPAEGWVELSPKSGDGKLWKVSGIMHNLSNLHAVQVEGSPTDLKPFGLDAPKKKVTIQSSRGDALAELWVGADKDNNVYVKTPKDPRVFQVDRFKVADLPDTAEDLLYTPPDGGAPAAP